MEKILPIRVYLLRFSFITFYLCLKDHLYQKHIQHCSHAYTQQIISLPNMQHCHSQYCRRFRHAMRRSCYGRVFQTIHDQHTDHRRRQHLTQILYDRRDLLSFRKYKKGHYPRTKCRHRHYQNDQNRSSRIYRDIPVSFESCFLDTKSINMHSSMVGNTKFALPKI